jgi:hypothetical protein
MLPLASASGPAIIGVVVICAALFLAWLLRMDAGDAAAGPEAEAGGDGTQPDGTSEPGTSGPA